MRHRRADPIPRWSAKNYETAQRRLAMLETRDVLNWADAAAAGIQRGFEDHRKDGNTDSLDEIEVGLITMWAAVQDLRERAVVAR